MIFPASAALIHFPLYHIELFRGDDGLVISLNIILWYFALVDLGLLGQVVDDIGFLKQGVAFVFLVAENRFDCADAPLVFASGCLNAIRSEFFCDTVVGNPSKKKIIDSADCFRFLLVYNKRGITSELVIRKLIEMAKKINAEQEKGRDLGLSQEEIAFYDALADHKMAVQVLGEEKLHLIAQELVKLIKNEAGVDWEKRKNIQARMRVSVKKLLRKYGYPPDIAPQAVNTVVEQAELMASNE